MSFLHKRLQKHDATHDAASDVLQGLKRWTRERPASDMTLPTIWHGPALGAADAAAAADYVEGFNAADRSVIGAAALAKQQSAEDEIQGGRLFHVQEGYDQLPLIMARALGNSASRSFSIAARAM